MIEGQTQVLLSMTIPCFTLHSVQPFVMCLHLEHPRRGSGAGGAAFASAVGAAFALAFRAAFGAAFASAFGAAFASARRALSTGRGSPAIASDTRGRVVGVLHTDNRGRLRWSTSGWMFTSCGLVGTRASSGCS